MVTLGLSVFHGVSKWCTSIVIGMVIVVCQDMKPMEVYGTEFLVDNTNLGFVATDREKNLTVFMYQPDSVHSSGGTILLKKADMNIGSWLVFLMWLDQSYIL